MKAGNIMRFKYLILIMVLVISGYSQTKYSDSRKLFREIMSKGSSIVGYMESKDLEVVKIDVDLISPDKDKQIVKCLSDSHSYLISVVGQPSVIESMGISIYCITPDAGTILVSISEDSVPCPRIVFKPGASGDYLISLKVLKMIEGSQNPMGYFFLAIAHD
jgi:hypothetical protein